MKRFSLGLSADSIKRAVNELQAYKDGLSQKCDELSLGLAKTGKNAAMAAVPSDTAELANSIQYEHEGTGKYSLFTENEYAAFVEFGTGVVGEGTYPGDLPNGWDYDTRRTPQAHDANDPTRWYYYDKNGKRRSTRGQEGSAFMLQAAETMRQQKNKLAREVFDD